MSQAHPIRPLNPIRSLNPINLIWPKPELVSKELAEITYELIKSDSSYIWLDQVGFNTFYV